MLLITFIASSIVMAIPVTRAAEPTLENILDTLGFPLRTLEVTETLAAGTYTTTMYAEYAGFRDSNQLKSYKVGTTTFSLIFDGSEGVPPGDPMGLVSPPQTKTFVSADSFGLSLFSPDGTWYTETSRNIDGQKHARIYQSQTDSNLYLMGFENMGVGSGSDFDYNDMVLSLERVQVQLTVVSAYDSPNPTSGSYTPETSITASVTSPVPGPVGTQYVCTGWTGTGDVPGSGTGTTVTFTITQDSSITWNWKPQYYLTVKTDPPGAATIGVEGWYDADAAVTLTAPFVSGSYRFWGWDVDGVPKGNTNPINVQINAPHTATAHYSNSAVGGEWAPINTVQLVTPWIALMFSAIAFAAAGSHRLLKKRL
jgi:hypothetical protein